MQRNTFLSRWFTRTGRVGAWSALGVCGLGLAALLSPGAFRPWSNAGSASARTVEALAVASDDPADDEAEEIEQATRQVLRDNCLICHSDEMISGQRLTPAQWKAEVEKMVKQGSPLPPEQVEPLVAFLAKHYPDSAPDPTPARLTYAQALELVKPDLTELGGDPSRGAALYAANCAICHGPTAQGLDLGPNLVEIATLLRPADFRDVTRNGRHRMPGFKTVLKPDQETDMLAWLRTPPLSGCRGEVSDAVVALGPGLTASVGPASCGAPAVRGGRVCFKRRGLDLWNDRVLHGFRDIEAVLGPEV